MQFVCTDTCDVFTCRAHERGLDMQVHLPVNTLSHKNRICNQFMYLLRI